MRFFIRVNVCSDIFRFGMFGYVALGRRDNVVYNFYDRLNHFRDSSKELKVRRRL